MLINAGRGRGVGAIGPTAFAGDPPSFARLPTTSFAGPLTAFTGDPMGLTGLPTACSGRRAGDLSHDAVDTQAETEKQFGFGVGKVCRSIFNDNSKNRKGHKLHTCIIFQKLLVD